MPEVVRSIVSRVTPDRGLQCGAKQANRMRLKRRANTGGKIDACCCLYSRPALDRSLLRDLPSSAVSGNATDTVNALMRAVAVGLIDAADPCPDQSPSCFLLTR